MIFLSTLYYREIWDAVGRFSTRPPFDWRQGFLISCRSEVLKYSISNAPVLRWAEFKCHPGIIWDLLRWFPVIRLQFGWSSWLWVWLISKKKCWRMIWRLAGPGRAGIFNGNLMVWSLAVFVWPPSLPFLRVHLELYRFIPIIVQYLINISGI